jgi:hypothetical protein
MSFRELTMIDVKEVLRRWTAGQSARQMAREGVVGRRTATRYIEAAKAIGLGPSAELTDEAVRDVAARVQTRPPPTMSDPRQVLGTHRLRIERWLEQDKPLTLVRVHELLARDGIAVSYTTLRRSSGAAESTPSTGCSSRRWAAPWSPSSALLVEDLRVMPADLRHVRQGDFAVGLAPDDHVCLREPVARGLDCGLHDLHDGGRSRGRAVGVSFRIGGCAVRLDRSEKGAASEAVVRVEVGMIAIPEQRRQIAVVRSKRKDDDALRARSAKTLLRHSWSTQPQPRLDLLKRTATKSASSSPRSISRVMDCPTWIAPSVEPDDVARAAHIARDAVREPRVAAAVRKKSLRQSSLRLPSRERESL